MPDTTPVYALPFQALTDAPNGPTLGEDLALAVEDQIARLDAAIATINGLAIATASETTVQGPYSSATPDPGAQACGVAFTAPASGAVVVHWHADFWSAINDHVSFVSMEVRTGAPIGGGVVQVGANSNDALKVSGNVVTGVEPRIAAGTWRPITGLTPGSAYHVRLMHFCEAGGNISVFYRKVLVVPAL